MSARAGVLAGWCVLLLAACNSLPGKPTEAERPLRPSQVVAFAPLYTQNCAGCHGADARLGAARPLNDALYLTLIGEDRLRQVTADGVPGTAMPGFAIRAGGTLTDEQLAALAKGVYAAWGQTPVRDATLPPYVAAGAADAPRGAAAYATFCAGCHGADGRGGDKGGSIVDGSYLALVSDQALRSTVICGRSDLGMPDWRGHVPGRVMTDQEINDVVAWLAAQRRQFPGQPYAKAD